MCFTKRAHPRRSGRTHSAPRFRHSEKGYAAPMIAVPEQFAYEIVEREGAAGAHWIAALPGLVGELLERWGCIPTGPAMHGKVGLVIPVRRNDGSAAVLKVSFPHPGNVHEPTAYATWAGHGAVLLFDRDDARFAMLLERV